MIGTSCGSGFKVITCLIPIDKGDYAFSATEALSINDILEENICLFVVVFLFACHRVFSGLCRKIKFTAHVYYICFFFFLCMEVTLRMFV